MAELEFHIKELKCTGVYTGNEDQSNRRTRLSSLLSLFKSKPTPEHDSYTPEGYNPIDYKIFFVLQDILQPNSTVSPINAAEFKRISIQISGPQATHISLF